jgi:IS30 family transposase
VIAGRTPLSERPGDGLAGHLESDSMVWSASRGLLSAQVDRLLKVCRLRWCPDRTAAETLEALRRCAETLPHRFVRDVAFDNGSEGARHLEFREEYGAMTYFCAPRSPWQKSQVENLNRTIRHWLPRKTKAQDLAALDWHDLEERLNNLPRKSLGYLTPKEALNQYLASGALVA